MTVLPDILKLGLTVVFCGTAVGARSAQVGAYYAGRGNRFWEVLHQIGLMPRKLDSHEFHILPDYGVGLTDLVKTCSGSDKALRPSAFDVPGFCSKVNSFSPRVVAFNGKKAARVFFGCRVDYGGPKYDERMSRTMIFVLPSTAASARRWWNQSHWTSLAAFVDDL